MNEELPWDDECQRRLFRVVPIAALEKAKKEPLARCYNGGTRGLVQLGGAGTYDDPFITLGFAFDNDRVAPIIHEIDGTYGRIFFRPPYDKFKRSVDKHVEAIQDIPGCRISKASKMKKTIDVGFECSDMDVPEFKRTVKMLMGVLEE